MPTGKVRWYSQERGFGFINPDDEPREPLFFSNRNVEKPLMPPRRPTQLSTEREQRLIVRLLDVVEEEVPERQYWPILGKLLENCLCWLSQESTHA